LLITPRVHLIEGITRPSGGWTYARPNPERLTSTFRFHHQRYSIYFPAVIIENGSLAFFDAGTPESMPCIERSVESLGFELGDLKSIIISHGHVDHIGELKHLVEISGAKVYAHDAEIPYLLKQKHQECDAREFESTAIDVALKDGDTLDLLGGLKVIHTPGHTAGHLALYAEKQRTLFAADLIRHSRGEFHLPPPEYSVDYPLLIESLVKVSQYDFDKLVLYHGEPILQDADKRLREFVAYLKAMSDIFLPSIKDALAPEMEG